ncbi:hypothetical protein U9M48_034204 [Paspalum notatum var. saurae]|uniref:Non-haem dioxygenase N-terminal domain-containing protein n=1 Tax=Paspalum notatum var. saurae TaxID=547442 RepID=A0AAQ3UA99_PASNO
MFSGQCSALLASSAPRIVVNHGISKSVMKDALDVALEFFALSTEHKEKFASVDIQRPIRYDTSSRDGISKVRSFLKHYANPLQDWVQFWASGPCTLQHTGNLIQNSFARTAAHDQINESICNNNKKKKKRTVCTREKMGEYAVEIQKVSMQLMEAILQGLGLGAWVHQTIYIPTAPNFFSKKNILA